MSAWEDIDVRQVLALSEAKHDTIVAANGDSNDTEFDALNNYIDLLEEALNFLGLNIDEHGMITPSNPQGHSTTPERKATT